jgi:catechol 2,3-dioxygenase-like lactoylglutathione lyase family enzyme
MKSLATSIGIAALGLAACASAQGEVRTPEGAIMNVDENLAYKPGELSEEQLSSSTRHLFTADFMNVFRRFPREKTEAMVKFYTEALALRSLSPIQLTSSQQMILTGVGGGQIKLSAGQPEGREYHPGGIGAATGIRFFMLTYPDMEAVKKRFAEAGFDEPQFAARQDGFHQALVQDPGGFDLVILVRPGARDNSNDGVGVGINVSDLEASRAFYRDFVGLEELPPVDAPVLGTRLYPYRNGETTIMLFHTGSDVPNDDGSAGIQYIVGDAAMVDAKAKHRGGIGVQTPLNKLNGFDLTTIWLSDPDGVTNYFAQVGPNSRTAQQARAED